MLVPPFFFSKLLSSAPPYLPPSTFYPSGPSGSFPLVYRLRALALRDVLLFIHMTDAAVISFLFSPNFLLFSFGRYHVFTAPRRT